MNHQEEINQLFKKYIENQCSKEEEKAFFEYLQSTDNELIFKNLIDLELQQDLDKPLKNIPDIKSAINIVRDKVTQEIGGEGNQIHPQKNRLWFKVSVAAAIFLCMGISFFYHAGKKQGLVTIPYLAADVPPGSNKATLTLADGSKIVLDEVPKGKLVSEAGMRITKTEDGQLVYTIGQDNTEQNLKESTAIRDPNMRVLMNTISIPRGGQFQILLPDGTKVWLNAESWLRFPVTFANLHERRVEFRGEAYFEVVKNKSKPFIVQSDKQTVQVLGTHFNIRSYADDADVKTTLLEGSVIIRPGEGGLSSKSLEVLLKPGQQSQIHSGSNQVKIATVDTEAEIAWKNGQFSFENESIENIMKQISRWYDVEVIYEDNVDTKTVWGSITRYSNVSKVLKILELTGQIHFEVEGRRIIVKK